MARDYIRLNGAKYTLGRGKAYESLWSMTQRPTQRGESGGLAVAEWDLNRVGCDSFEDIAGSGIGCLGIDYGDNTDARWVGVHTIGPLINTLTLPATDAHSATPLGGTGLLGSTFYLGPALANATANGLAQMYSSAAIATYGYVPHGQYVAKIRLSDMTIYDSQLILPTNATDIVRTQAVDGSVAQEVAIGMGDTEPYWVLQQGGLATPPAKDVWNPNSGNIPARGFNVAPDGRAVALYSNLVRANALTGTVTMRAPNWQTIATIPGEQIRLNSVAFDGNLWVVGASNGPLLLDDEQGEFFPIFGKAIDNDNVNCLRLAEWYALGVIVPLRDGTRYQRGGIGESWGIERFGRNTSGVQGRALAHAGSTKWLYQALYNDITGHTYIIAWRPAQIGDGHSNPMTPFTIARFSSLRCDFLSYIGTVNGERTNPTLMGGYGNNAFWMTIGRSAREIDDSNYRFATGNPAGTAYLTELRRYPEIIKDLERVEFETSHCSATQTVTVAIAVDGGSANVISGAYSSGNVINGIVNTDGFHDIRLIDDASPNAPLSWATGRRIKPELRFRTGVNTDAPRIEGTLRLYYRWRPLMVNVYTFTIRVKDDGVGTAESYSDALLALKANAPVLMQEDMDNDSYYVRISEAQVIEIGSIGGGKDTAGTGSYRDVKIVAETWMTTA